MAEKLIAGLDPKTYARHLLHGETRAWTETNCYVDLWIETLHGVGLDPIAALAFTVGIDLEGDQFTFFKYPHRDLEELYGVDIIELNIWRPLHEQAAEQIALGRAPVVEVDAWFLPDTAGNSYHHEHIKTSVTMEEVDLAERRMRYFHGQGYWELSGEDFDGVFRLGPRPPGAVELPPYVEVVKLSRQPPLAGAALGEVAEAQLRRHLGRRPRENPFAAYRAKLERDLGWLKDATVADFHAYAFATLRQFGANFELCATFLRWLDERRPRAGLADAATDFEAISTTAKTMQFKLARAVQGKRQVDFAPMHDELCSAWTRGQERLTAIAGG